GPPGHHMVRAHYTWMSELALLTSRAICHHAADEGQHERAERVRAVRFGGKGKVDEQVVDKEGSGGGDVLGGGSLRNWLDLEPFLPVVPEPRARMVTGRRD